MTIKTYLLRKHSVCNLHVKVKHSQTEIFLNLQTGCHKSLNIQAYSSTVKKFP